MSSLFPAGAGRAALRFGERSLTYPELAGAAGALAGRLRDADRVAVWAAPTLETAVAVVAALLAGVPAVPLNPRSGEAELGHVVKDSAPALVLAAPGETFPAALAGVERVDVDVTARAATATPAALPRSHRP